MTKARPPSKKSVKSAADRAEGKPAPKDRMVEVEEGVVRAGSTLKGRPTSYKPEYALQAEKLCVLGATDIEVADFFGISVATVSNWKNEHSDFLEALKSGKEKSDERVERSLYHRAIGYSFDAVKIFNGKYGVVTVPYREHIPPDTTAMIFWLKNRRKDRWRDRHELTGADGGAINLIMKADDGSLL